MRVRRSSVPVVIVFVVAAAAACSAASTHSTSHNTSSPSTSLRPHYGADPSISSPSTSVRLATAVAPLPSGWKRYSYGALSVGAPETWSVRVGRDGLSCLVGIPEYTVTEWTQTQLVPQSCPAMPSRTNGAPAAPGVQISCVRAEALRVELELSRDKRITGSTSTTVVRGRTLVRGADSIWLRGPGWAAAVAAAGPRGLVQAMLATVQPTGRAC